MSQDKLERYRRVAQRANPNAFYEWLETACHNAVPHEQLRNLPKQKRDIVEEIILESLNED